MKPHADCLSHTVYLAVYLKCTRNRQTGRRAPAQSHTAPSPSSQLPAIHTHTHMQSAHTYLWERLHCPLMQDSCANGVITTAARPAMLDACISAPAELNTPHCQVTLDITGPNLLQCQHDRNSHSLSAERRLKDDCANFPFPWFLWTNVTSELSQTDVVNFRKNSQKLCILACRSETVHDIHSSLPIER